MLKFQEHKLPKEKLSDDWNQHIVGPEHLRPQKRKAEPAVGRLVTCTLRKRIEEARGNLEHEFADDL